MTMRYTNRRLLHFTIEMSPDHGHAHLVIISCSHAPAQCTSPHSGSLPLSAHHVWPSTGRYHCSQWNTLCLFV